MTTVLWRPSDSATGAGSPALSAAAIAPWSTTGFGSTGAVFFAAAGVEVLCVFAAACGAGAGAAGVVLCVVLAPGPDGWGLIRGGVATDEAGLLLSPPNLLPPQ